MGLGGCYSILKYLLVVFNLLFLVLGVAGIVFGVWMLVDPTFSVSLTQESNDYLISIIIILVASILLVIVAGIGVYGALKESQCALTSFFCLLLIIFVAEISAGLWAYINRESLEVQVRNAVKLTVEQEYSHNDNRRLLFDTFQRNLNCCGAEKPTDWMANKQVRISVKSDPNAYNIPESCCRRGKTQEECQLATRNVKMGAAINYDVIYEQGCYSLIIQHLRDHACLIMGIGLGVAAVELLGLIFSLILAFAVNRSRRYKA